MTIIAVRIAVYVFAGLFLLLAAGLLFAFHRTKHHGLLLIACAYGGGAGLALALAHWWPLAAAFALAWILRLVGLDPGGSLRRDRG